jgi:hypothetical protein
MTDDRGTLRRISWREIFPWLAILRAFPLALSPTVLVLATLGVFVSSLGWRIGPYLFFSAEGRRNAGLEHAWASGEWPAQHLTLPGKVPSAVVKYLPAERNGITDSFLRLAEPAARLFSYNLTLNETAYYLFGFLWSLAVWAFVGGFITRRAVFQTALEDTPGIVETARFASRRWPWYVLAPLYPLLGILILLILHLPLGWLMQAEVGVVIAGVVWILVLLAGIAGAWLLIGLLLGWPLMWGTLSAEREGDAFEAFSRSFSYVFGRPLHYFFYAVVAALVGALGYALVFAFVTILIEFGFWAVSWGASGERVHEIRQAMAVAAVDPVASGESSLYSGARWLNFWQNFALQFLQGYAFAYFWSAAGIIYLLLRSDVDDKEMDDVYLPDDEPATLMGPPPPSKEPSSVAPVPPVEDRQSDESEEQAPPP